MVAHGLPTSGRRSYVVGHDSQDGSANACARTICMDDVLVGEALRLSDCLRSMNSYATGGSVMARSKQGAERVCYLKRVSEEGLPRVPLEASLAH